MYFVKHILSLLYQFILQLLEPEDCVLDHSAEETQFQQDQTKHLCQCLLIQHPHYQWNNSTLVLEYPLITLVSSNKKKLAIMYNIKIFSILKWAANGLQILHTRFVYKIYNLFKDIVSIPDSTTNKICCDLMPILWNTLVETTTKYFS